MSPITNLDGSIRQFICDEHNGCNKPTLVVFTDENTLELKCPSCGHRSVKSGCIALTNPNGSGSFIGLMPAGYCL